MDLWDEITDAELDERLAVLDEEQVRDRGWLSEVAAAAGRWLGRLGRGRAPRV
jgi:hypothetical protein